MNVLFFHLSIWRTNLWRLQRFKVRMFNCLIFQGNLSWENFQLWKIRMRIERLPTHFDPLSTNSKKWSNTLKQFVSNFSTNCLSVFDHFVKLALKGSNNRIIYIFWFSNCDHTDSFHISSLLKIIQILTFRFLIFQLVSINLTLIFLKN